MAKFFPRHVLDDHAIVCAKLAVLRCEDDYTWNYLPRSKAKDKTKRIQFRVFLDKSLRVKNLRIFVINWIQADWPVDV